MRIGGRMNEDERINKKRKTTNVQKRKKEPKQK
jgi:hypothetical protein